MFRWMLAAGLLLVNVWLGIAIMVALANRGASPSTYAMGILLAVGLTFIELKGVEKFAHWRAPQLDPRPGQDYLGIVVAAALLFAVSVWMIAERVKPDDPENARIERTHGPSNPGSNLERGGAASARIDQAEQ